MLYLEVTYSKYPKFANSVDGEIYMCLTRDVFEKFAWYPLETENRTLKQWTKKKSSKEIILKQDIDFRKITKAVRTSKIEEVRSWFIKVTIWIRAIRLLCG